MTARANRAATRLLTAATTVTLALGLAACADDTTPAPEATTIPPPVVSEPTTEPEPDTTATDDAATTPTDDATTPTADATTPPADAPTADAPTAEETAPAALPPFAQAGTPQTGEPSGAPLLPVGVRVGDHDGYERVVVELAGDGVPGWRTEYVPEAIEDGRGNRVDVDGDAILQVHVHGTRYPEEGEEHPAPHVVDGDDVVEEVHFLGTFEGMTQLFIGVDDGVADYRVFALADPARLIVDIVDHDD